MTLRLSGHDLICHRGGREIFSGIGFVLAAGETLAVTGRNGAGKTSLLRIIAGLLRQTSGAVALNGGDAELTVGEQAHYLGHRDALKPALTVAENLAFWRGYFARTGDPEAAALETVGLGAIGHLPAAYLSAGQRRRLSLARLLAVPRPVWLLDEPAAALDAPGQALLTKAMTAHLAGGGLIVAATHAALDVPVRELRIGDPA